MLKKDFLMRFIEQLQGIIPYLLDLTKAGNYGEAHAVVDQAVREVVGIGTDGVIHLPDDVLLEALRADQGISWEEKALFLATLLYEEAEILVEEGQEEAAYGRYVKALNLLCLLADTEMEEADLAELVPDIERLVTCLDAYHLPAGTAAHLLQYYAQTGNFSAAEDVLFDWLENDEGSAVNLNPIERGINFYTHLLTLSDEELAAGNLTREEVESGLAELQDL